ncbi:MAG: hypothetical protein R2932_54450 [Caldilineaceae bacterium]
MAICVLSRADGAGIGAFNTPNTSAVMRQRAQGTTWGGLQLAERDAYVGPSRGVAILGSFFAFRLQTYGGAGMTVDQAGL